MRSRAFGATHAYRFDARKVRIVAAKFELQDPWHAEALGEGGGTRCLCHFLRCIQTDRKRCLDFRSNRNICQFPGTLAGSFRFKIP